MIFVYICGGVKCGVSGSRMVYVFVKVVVVVLVVVQEVAKMVECYGFIIIRSLFNEVVVVIAVVVVFRILTIILQW